MESAQRYSFNIGQCVLGVSSVTDTVIIHKLTSHRCCPEDAYGPSSLYSQPVEQSLKVESEDHPYQCHLGSLFQVHIPRLLPRLTESDFLD